MNTLSFQAPETLVKQLEQCAMQMDRSKAYIIRQALVAYLEDMEDVAEAKRIQESYAPSEALTLAEVKRRLDLL